LLIRALDASRRGERAAHLPGEHADPQQRQPNLRRRAKVKIAAEPHREKINVGLARSLSPRLVKARKQVEDRLEAAEEYRVLGSVANWIDDDRTYSDSGTGT
jgi:hypothetical protein